MALISSELNNKKRKLHHKLQCLSKVSSQTENINLQIKRKRANISFQISGNTSKKRKLNPTSENISDRSKIIRRNETLVACTEIHGGSVLQKGPALNGIMDTLTTKFKTTEVTNKILSSKPSLVASIKKRVVGEYNKKYYNSQENKLRSLNAYYSHHVLGKRKYLNLRKANRQAKYENVQIANYIPYCELAAEIRNVPIGEYHDISDLIKSSTEENVSGVYRKPADFILRLAKFYCHVNTNREDKLKKFDFFPCQDESSFLFALALGGDGAPGTGMAILISFLNVGERLASSSEQYLLFGGNVDESSTYVSAFFKLLVKDISYLETKVFEIEVNGGSQKIEFKVCEWPNDMKMLCFLGGELSNNATYFSTFANITKKDSNDFTKTFGNSEEHSFRPFSFDKRLSDGKKALNKEKELNKSNLSKVTKRSNLTSYIASLGSRQVSTPLIGNYIDLAKAEPLHLKNNTIKERFMILFKICVSQTNFKGAKSFKDIPVDTLFYKFVDFTRKGMNCNFLAKKIERWFNENSGKFQSEFTFRFRGTESLYYMRHFPELIKLLVSNITDNKVISRIFEIHFQSIHLRSLLSYSVRISNFTHNDLCQMKSEAILLFKACCIFDGKVTPSLWTLCNVVPVHAEACLKMYGYGLGCNTMEGREQKHQMIAKYSENTTVQNKWPLVLRHEFIQLIHLRENGYDAQKYKKRSTTYVPDNKNSCESCCLVFEHGKKECFLCTNSNFLKVKVHIENV